MIYTNHQNKIANSGTIMYLLSGCLICWVGSFIESVGFPIYGEVAAPSLWNLLCSHLSDKTFTYIFGFLLMIGGAFMIHRTNYILMLIREKTLLPVLFYILLISTNSDFLPLKSTSFGVFFLILTIYYLFISYHDAESQRNLFNAGLILAVGSLLWTYILWFFPLLWYGMNKFRAISARTFLASLLGLIVISWLLFNYSIWQHDYSTFSAYESIFKIRPLSIFGNNFADWLAIGWMIGLTLLSSANIITHEYDDNLRTREFLSYLTVLALSSFILYFLYEQSSEEFLQIACFPSSILMAHFFTVVRNKYTFWLFHISVLMFIFLSIYRLWIF